MKKDKESKSYMSYTEHGANIADASSVKVISGRALLVVNCALDDVPFRAGSQIQQMEKYGYYGIFTPSECDWKDSILVVLAAGSQEARNPLLLCN